MTGLLRGLDARAPDHTDLEERQLINVVAEMGVAAGITPPRVLMLDANLSNAALLGIARDEAVVVVTRQLLDDVDRGELQAVLGHLISSVVNGDLWVADALFVLRLVRGLVGYVLQRMAGGHPESPCLWRVLRDPDDADAAAHAVGVLLADPGPRANENLVVRLLRVLWNDLVARPLATAMWRRRCLLAGATDAEQFFVVWPAPVGDRRTRNWAGMSTALHPAIEQRLAQARSLGAALPRLGL